MITITAGAGELRFSSEAELLGALQRLYRTGAVPVKRVDTPTHIMFEWYGVTFKFTK